MESLLSIIWMGRGPQDPGPRRARRRRPVTLEDASAAE
jgi:hypothetical protein